MNKKIKWFLVGGISLAVLTYLVELIFLTNCKDGLGCLAIGAIYQIPGALMLELLNLTGSTALKLSSICFYFILGGLIGLIIYRFRNKK